MAALPRRRSRRESVVNALATALWLRAKQSFAGANALVAIDADGAASRAYYALATASRILGAVQQMLPDVFPP